MAKGTIYLYFNTKADIMAALILQSRQLLFDKLSGMALTKPDPLSAIKGIIGASYAFYKKNPLHYDLVSRAEANPALTETDELQEATQATRNRVMGYINQPKAAGQIRAAIDTIPFSMYSWGTVTGLIQIISRCRDLINADDPLENQKIEDHRPV